MWTYGSQEEALDLKEHKRNRVTGKGHKRNRVTGKVHKRNRITGKECKNDRVTSKVHKRNDSQCQSLVRTESPVEQKNDKSHW